MKRIYRIAIVGTHSTGKTTLAKALSKVLNIPYTQRDFAIDIANKISPNKNMDQLLPAEHWEIQKEILDGYKKMLTNSQSFVSDGTIFTWKAYTEEFVGQELLSKIPLYPDYEKTLSELKKQYPHIFYLPPEIPLKADGFRPVSNTVRLALDNAILKELSSVQYIKLTGSLPNRLKEAQHIIQNNTDAI